MRVVITGANRGIGLGLVRAYADRSDMVHATARLPEAADALRVLQTERPSLLQIHRLDVTRDEACQELVQALRAAPVDVLINNAAMNSRFMRLADLDMQDALRAFDTNALGPLRVAR